MGTCHIEGKKVVQTRLSCYLGCSQTTNFDIKRNKKKKNSRIPVQSYVENECSMTNEKNDYVIGHIWPVLFFSMQFLQLNKFQSK